jgi:hypothetical protein
VAAALLPRALPPIRLLALLLLLLPLAACDSNEPDRSIGGLYVATETVDGSTVRFTLDVPTTSNGSFTLGSRSNISGRFDGATITIDVTGTGRYDHPNIETTIATNVGGQSESERLTGTVSDSRGSLTLRDTEGTTYTFTRQ